jgi:hypothetical protein
MLNYSVRNLCTSAPRGVHFQSYSRCPHMVPLIFYLNPLVFSCVPFLPEVDPNIVGKEPPKDNILTYMIF